LGKRETRPTRTASLSPRKEGKTKNKQSRVNHRPDPIGPGQKKKENEKKKAQKGIDFDQKAKKLEVECRRGENPSMGKKCESAGRGGGEGLTKCAFSVREPILSPG